MQRGRGRRTPEVVQDHVDVTGGRPEPEELAAEIDGLLAPMTGRLGAADQRRLGALLGRLVD